MDTARKGQRTRSVRDYILIGSNASKQLLTSLSGSKCTEYNRSKEVRAAEVGDGTENDV
jgi:hypothetical protein